WGYFGTSTPIAFVAPNDPLCDGQHWTPVGGSVSGNRPDYPYSITFRYAPTSGSASYCADVTVYKCDGLISTNASGAFVCTPSSPSVIHTTVHADGYNTSCATLSTNPRALQRSVELHY